MGLLLITDFTAEHSRIFIQFHYSSAVLLNISPLQGFLFSNNLNNETHGTIYNSNILNEIGENSLAGKSLNTDARRFVGSFFQT